MTVDLTVYLVISAWLFAIGAFGLVAKRNLAAIVMSAGLMFSASVLALVAFSRFNLVAGHRVGGQAFALVVALASAGDVGLGLTLVRVAGRHRGTLSVDELAN